MYQVALSVNPEQLESIATMLYVEMLRNGYTSVAEFHYLHHDEKGHHYANLSELGERLISAAKNSIKITATDLEIEYKTTIEGVEVKKEGEVTVSARKLADLVRSIPYFYKD